MWFTAAQFHSLTIAFCYPQVELIKKKKAMVARNELPHFLVGESNIISFKKKVKTIFVFPASMKEHVGETWGRVAAVKVQQLMGI